MLGLASAGQQVRCGCSCSCKLISIWGCRACEMRL
jgi:hypothetical protein